MLPTPPIRVLLVDDHAVVRSGLAVFLMVYEELQFVGEASNGLEAIQKCADLQPDVVSGVPPDAFSATGQRWGNPLYNWTVMRERGYEWWIQRLRWATRGLCLSRNVEIRPGARPGSLVRPR